MKTQTLGSWLLALALLVSGTEAAAKRLGGGASVGKQSSQVTQRNAAQPAPAQPAAPQAPAPAQTPAKAAGTASKEAPAAAPSRPWGAMLGGLAAGLGLVWLASALGFGEAFAQLLTALLLAGLFVLLLGWVLRRRTGGGAPLAAQTAGVAQPLTLRSYEATKVGNDAAARPWERTQFGQDTAAGGLIGSALQEPGPRAGTWGIPADFDVEGFLRASKENFVRLQAAWDRGDIPALRALMTDDMLAQIEAQLAEREASAPGVPNVTEVVTLDAQLLGIEDLGDEWLASVEFSGLIREHPAQGPTPFREVWNISRAKQGRAGWLVAGVQALQ
jgi:predicted lipid-binding transport protein (Tim44 family)